MKHDLQVEQKVEESSDAYTPKIRCWLPVARIASWVTWKYFRAWTQHGCRAQSVVLRQDAAREHKGNTRTRRGRGGWLTAWYSQRGTSAPKPLRSVSGQSRCRQSSASVLKLVQLVRFHEASSDATEPPYRFSSHCCAATRPAAVGGRNRYSPRMNVLFGTGFAYQASSESVKKPRMSLCTRPHRQTNAQTGRKLSVHRTCCLRAA